MELLVLVLVLVLARIVIVTIASSFSISIPFFSSSWRPDSFYDKIVANAASGLHTLAEGPDMFVDDTSVGRVAWLVLERECNVPTSDLELEAMDREYENTTLLSATGCHANSITAWLLQVTAW